MRLMIDKPGLVLTFLLATPLLSLPPQTDDPLWLKSQAHLHAVSNFVASETLTRMQICDPDGKNLETSEIKTKVTGWKDGEPIRSVVSHTGSEISERNDLNKTETLANHPDQSMEYILTAKRGEEVQLDKEICVVFHVTGNKKNKVPFAGNVWIEKESGLLVRALFVFDVSHIPMAKAMTYSTEFIPFGDRHCVPKEISADSTVSVLFSKKRIIIQKQYSGWVPRQ